jgi:hypothetical protein
VVDGKTRYEDEISGCQVFDEGDRVQSLHPVFVVPQTAAEGMRSWFVAMGREGLF